MMEYFSRIWAKYVVSPDPYDDEYYKDLVKESQWNIPTSLDTDINPEIYNKE